MFGKSIQKMSGVAAVSLIIVSSAVAKNYSGRTFNLEACLRIDRRIARM